MLETCTSLKNRGITISSKIYIGELLLENLWKNIVTHAVHVVNYRKLLFMLYRKTTLKISVIKVLKKNYCKIIVGESRFIIKESMQSNYHLELMFKLKICTRKLLL
jgi:hypothetical protein